ncbi:hypothetical protein ACHAO1_006266 [Botrytis cinerea]
MSSPNLPNQFLKEIMLYLEFDSLMADQNANPHKWLLPITTCSELLSELATPGLYRVFWAKDIFTFKLSWELIPCAEEDTNSENMDSSELEKGGGRVLEKKQSELKG